MVHSVKYLQKSVRWLNLSVALWSMIIVDANRIVDVDSLSSFLAAMLWRVNGDINEEEFTEVFREWMGRAGVRAPHRYNCSVFVLRDLLLAQGATSGIGGAEESDLDLLLGMVINETNRRLVGVPLNFSHNVSEAGTLLDCEPHSIKPTLELCSRRWLALCEELFFLLDCPGFGFLCFDQFFYFAACLVLAKREWLVESEAEEALSTTRLASLALQLMRDAGATVSIDTPVEDEHKQQLERRKNAVMLRRKSTTGGVSLPSKTSRQASIFRPPGSSPFILDEERERESKEVEEREKESLLELQRKLHSGQNSSVVSLTMFKALLVSRGLGEASLLALVAHVKHCTWLLAALGRKQSPVLHQTCTMYVTDDSGGNGEGGENAPRPFHRCVYSVAGWPFPSSTAEEEGGEDLRRDDEEGGTGKKMSPILLFLLSDVEGLIPGVWLASLELELLLSQNYNVVDDSSEVSDEENSMSLHFTHAQREIRSFSEKLTFDVAKKLWLRFSNWGDSAFEPGSKNFFELRERVPSDVEIRREPTFRFISSVLAEYRAALLLVSAGLLDLAMDHFSGREGDAGGAGVAASTLLPSATSLASLLAEMTAPLPSVTPPPQTFEASSSQLGTQNSIPFGRQSPPLSGSPPMPHSQNDPFFNDTNRRSSPLNFLFNSASVDSAHTKTSDEHEKIDDNSSLSVREQNKALTHQQQQQQSAIKTVATPRLPGGVRMEDLAPELMGEEDQDNFAVWVNTDEDGVEDARAASTNKKMTNCPSDSSKRQQSDITGAVWSSVFEVEEKDNVDEEKDKAIQEGGDGEGRREDQQPSSPLTRAEETPPPRELRTQQEHDTLQGLENRSVQSNNTAVSDTTSQFERREFFRNNTELLSDEGSPPSGGAGLSLLSQAKAGRFNHPASSAPASAPDTAERRRSRRKHRQVTKASKSSHAPELQQHQHQEQEQGSENDSRNILKPEHNDHHKENNDEKPTDENKGANPWKGQGERVTLGADSDSDYAQSRESMEKQFLAALGSEKRGGKGGGTGERDLDAVSVASSSSSMANSVIELLERGQTAGLYAQSLRDLLRKMSRGDNNMNLKSLEKIIELGNSIVEQEGEGGHHSNSLRAQLTHQQAGRRSAGGGGSPRKLSQASPRAQTRAPAFAAGPSPAPHMSKSRDKKLSASPSEHHRQQHQQHQPQYQQHHQQQGQQRSRGEAQYTPTPTTPRTTGAPPSREMKSQHSSGGNVGSKATGSTKKRIPGVVPTPKSRNNKQAFSL